MMDHKPRRTLSLSMPRDLSDSDIDLMAYTMGERVRSWCKMLRTSKGAKLNRELTDLAVETARLTVRKLLLRAPDRLVISIAHEMTDPIGVSLPTGWDGTRNAEAFSDYLCHRWMTKACQILGESKTPFFALHLYITPLPVLMSTPDGRVVVEWWAMVRGCNEPSRPRRFLHIGPRDSRALIHCRADEDEFIPLKVVHYATPEPPRSPGDHYPEGLCARVETIFRSGQNGRRTVYYVDTTKCSPDTAQQAVRSLHQVLTLSRSEE